MFLFSKKNNLEEDAISGNSKRRDYVYKTLMNDNEIYRYVSSLLKEGNSKGIDTDDVIQESFIRLDRSLLEDKFDGKSSIKTYFKTICRNYISDEVFRKKTSVFSKGDHNDMELQSDIAQKSLSPEDEFLSKINMNTIEELITKLSQKCRDYFEWYQEEMSMKEIALSQNINEQSVKNAMNRCREDLRTSILAHDLLKDNFTKIIQKRNG